MYNYSHQLYVVINIYILYVTKNLKMCVKASCEDALETMNYFL